jgi:RecB family endonuclease NucS
VAIYDLTHDDLTPVKSVTFASQKIHEREDLQRILRMHIDAVAPDTLVLAEEFSDWEDSSRSIDLLGLDKQGALVVIELKRTEDGGHMELQAIRYAAMIGKLTFADAVSAHAKFLGKTGGILPKPKMQS